MSRTRILHVAFIVLLMRNVTADDLVRKYPLKMPDFHPYRDELYLCAPVRILEKQYYIVGFEPEATMHDVHHMVLFGCSYPGATDHVWDCGEMGASDYHSFLTRAIPCQNGSHVLYAWARDATKLELPQDVGFQVGTGTKIKYLVLQVHYSKKFPDGRRDNSGINLLYTEKPQNKLAGVLLLGTGGTIPANSEEHMEVDCKIIEDKKIYPFAYRTHTHSLGKVVAGYRVRNVEYGVDNWTLLGKRDPLTPQMFYPVFNKEPIHKGDVLAARCTMWNYRDRETHVGPTNNDEMCNFYLMYYVENDSPLDMRLCLSAGPPQAYWRNSENNLQNIPELEASTL